MRIQHGVVLLAVVVVAGTTRCGRTPVPLDSGALSLRHSGIRLVDESQESPGGVELVVSRIDTVYSPPLGSSRQQLWDIVQLADNRFAVAHRDLCSLVVFTNGENDLFEALDACAAGELRGRQAVHVFPWERDSIGVFDSESETFRIYSGAGSFGRQIPVPLPGDGVVASAQLLSETMALLAFYPRPGQTPSERYDLPTHALLQMVRIGTGAREWARFQLPEIAARPDFGVAVGVVFCVQPGLDRTRRIAVKNPLMFEVFTGTLGGDDFRSRVRRSELPELGRGDDGRAIMKTWATQVACGAAVVTALHSVRVEGMRFEDTAVRGFLQVLDYDGRLMHELVLRTGELANNLRRAIYIGDGTFLGILEDQNGTALVRVETVEKA